MKQLQTPKPVSSGTGKDFTSIDLDDALNEMLEQVRSKKPKKKGNQTKAKSSVPPVRPIHQDGWVTTGLILINNEVECLACGTTYITPGSVLVERKHKRHGKHRICVKHSKAYIDEDIEFLPHTIEAIKSTVCGCQKCFDLTTLIQETLRNLPDENEKQTSTTSD